MIAPGQVCAVLLAAGRSQRFGPADKLLASIDGVPLVNHIARRLAGMGFGALIAVCCDARVSDLLAEAGFVVADNLAPQRGLSRSLALGIAAVPERCAAALVCLADMPRVPTGHLMALLDAFDPAAAPIVASSRDGQPMPPALFARAQFAALAMQTGDHGARELLLGARLVAADATQLADIDRPADLA
ncbi:MAG: nucleotidyltransferase family protein [Proteobacteria bacterium]|nr:nucleotidyltransferase family protein [Pseudomonadota bacterium]